MTGLPTYKCDGCGLMFEESELNRYLGSTLCVDCMTDAVLDDSLDEVGDE